VCVCVCVCVRVRVHVCECVHTCSLCGGDGGSLCVQQLSMNADGVLCVWGQVIKAVSGGGAAQPHFLFLTI